MSASHTPLPWVVDRREDAPVNELAIIAPCDGRTVASIIVDDEITERERADAALIAHACNCYPLLVGALEGGYRKLATYADVYPGDTELAKLLTQWTATISQARELA